MQDASPTDAGYGAGGARAEDTENEAPAPATP